MKKRVLLVNPSYNYHVKHEMYPSGALLLLGTLARQQGHKVSMVHMVTGDKSIEDIIEIVHSLTPDVVGITVSTFQVKVATELVTRLRPETSARIVIGGVHPTSIGLEAAKVIFPDADDIICGEGEHEFLSLLNGEYIAKPDNLDYIVPPDLSIPFVDLPRYTGAYPLGKKPAMFIMASRGCPGSCSFCNKSIFGNKVRYRSTENVIRELHYYYMRGIKEVFIQDDTFNLNHGWCQEILERIISSNLHMMRYRVPFRADEKLVNTKLLKLAKRAGVWLIFYGVESGDQGMLDRMGKRLKLDEIYRAVRLTKESGIKVETSFIVGLPGETQQSVNNTLRFYHKLSPFWSGCEVAIPFPSTPLYEEVQSKLRLHFDDYRPGIVHFRTDGMDKIQIRKAHSQLNAVMRIGKLKNMAINPQMLLETVRAM